MFLLPIAAFSIGALTAAALGRKDKRRQEPARRACCYVETFDGRIIHIVISRKKTATLQLLDICVDSTRSQFPPTAVFISQQLGEDIGEGFELIHMSSTRLKLATSEDPFYPLVLADVTGGKREIWKDNGYGWMANVARPSILIRICSLEVIPLGQLERIIDSQRTAIATASKERTDAKKKTVTLGQKIEGFEGQIVRLRLKLDEAKSETFQHGSQLKSHRVAEVRYERDLELARGTIRSLESQISELKTQIQDQSKTQRRNEELDARCSLQEEALKLIKARLSALSSGGGDGGEEGVDSHWGSFDSLPLRKEVRASTLHSTDVSRSRDQQLTPPAPVYQSMKAIQRFHVMKDSSDATPNLASARDLAKIHGLGGELLDEGVESPLRDTCVSLLRSKDVLMTSGKRKLMLDSDDD